MNVFVLCAGRCGSVTFAKACSHITNFTAAHESRCGELGDARLAFPENHIEIDNRLSWFLGRLDVQFGDRAVYVHLSRNPSEIAASYARRWSSDLGIIAAYAKGILKTRDYSADCAEDYVRTVTENIEHFLARRSRVHRVDIAVPHAAFRAFWTDIGARGDLDAALAEFSRTYNESRGKNSALSDHVEALVPIAQFEQHRDRLLSEKKNLKARLDAFKSRNELLRRSIESDAAATKLGKLILAGSKRKGIFSRVLFFLSLQRLLKERAAGTTE